MVDYWTTRQDFELEIEKNFNKRLCGGGLPTTHSRTKGEAISRVQTCKRGWMLITTSKILGGYLWYAVVYVDGDHISAEILRPGRYFVGAGQLSNICTRARPQLETGLR